MRFGRWALLARVVLSAGSRLDRRWASKRYRRAYFGGVNENVGKSHGLEIETALRLLPQLRLGGKYTYR